MKSAFITNMTLYSTIDFFAIENKKPFVSHTACQQQQRQPTPLAYPKKKKKTNKTHDINSSFTLESLGNSQNLICYANYYLLLPA